MKWLVAGDVALRDELAGLLRRAGHVVTVATGLAEAAAALGGEPFGGEPFGGLLLAPGDGWDAAIEWLRESSLATRVPTVLVSRDCDARLVLDAILAGARSLVLELDAPEKVLVALESALQAEPHPRGAQSEASGLSAAVACSAAEVFAGLLDGRLAFCAEARQGSSLQIVLEETNGKPLRERERSALEMLLDGQPLKAIASDLGLVVSSVWSLLDVARAKMGFRHRAELLAVMSALRSSGS
jgi:DNA-binding NarL/FixJ family response regulator